MILRPAVYDALSAILAEKVGFKYVATTGYGISASLIGKPDIGLVSFGEMLNRVGTISHAVHIPVTADVDTGYGNALNAYWTAKNFMWAGASGIQIEDQVWPKKCGHMLGKQIIPKEDMVAKVKACVKARDEEDHDFVVVARTDARLVAGLEETIARGLSYAEAGADCVYVEAPQSLKEVQSLVKSIPAPIAFNILEGGMTPPFELHELESLGVKIVSFPMTCLYAATKAMLDVLTILKETGDYSRYLEKIVSWNDFNAIIGLPEIRKLEFEFLPEQELRATYGTSDADQISRKEQENAQGVWAKRK